MAVGLQNYCILTNIVCLRVLFLWEQCGLRHEHLPLSVFLAERNDYGKHEC